MAQSLKCKMYNNFTNVTEICPFNQIALYWLRAIINIATVIITSRLIWLIRRSKKCASRHRCLLMDSFNMVMRKSWLNSQHFVIFSQIFQIIDKFHQNTAEEYFLSSIFQISAFAKIRTFATNNNWTPILRFHLKH